MLTERQQHVSEWLMEDAGLTGDLLDSQAGPIITWATRLAAAIAADEARSDAEVDAAISVIRRAIMRVVSAAAMDDSPADLLTRLQQTVTRLAPELQPFLPPVSSDPIDAADDRDRVSSVDQSPHASDGDVPETVEDQYGFAHQAAAWSSLWQQRRRLRGRLLARRPRRR